jgi:hypothetical protein
MSEFKFACPVCGQHITADSSASGTQLECPTCYRKIIVPQAPAAGESKFILSAAQVAKPRPAGFETASNLGAGSHGPARNSLTMFAFIAGVLVVVAGTTVFLLRGKLFSKPGTKPVAMFATNRPAGTPTKPSVPVVEYPIPTNVVWTLDPDAGVIPQEPVAGTLRGTGFHCDRAVLTGGTLQLRQAAAGRPELNLSIQFYTQAGEELSGKNITITPDRMPPVPKVFVRWKNEQQKNVGPSFFKGYALRVKFGQAANGRMPGELFLALPNAEKSVVAGTFKAEIRKPSPPKPPKPKGPPPNPPPNPPAG